MPKYEILDVTADPSVTFVQVSLTASPYRLSNLIGLWQPEKAVIVGGVVDNVPPISGNATLINSDPSNAPDVVTVSGKKFFETDSTMDERLVCGPTKPNGIILPDLSDVGLTFAFAFKLASGSTDNTQGFIAVGGYSIRLTTGGVMQFRSGINNLSTHTPAALTDFHTLVCRINVATTKFTAYVDGLQVSDVTSVNVIDPTLSTSVFAYISSANTDDRALAGLFSELFIYNAAITDAEMAALHTYLNTKYAI